MQNIKNIEFVNESREERLPQFEQDFPYIASRVILDDFIERFVPWHWHRAVELFYIESGEMEYETPRGKLVAHEGSGGMINSNVLHSSKVLKNEKPTIQLLHIFDVSLISGLRGSRIEQKYIQPLISDFELEALLLRPEIPGHAQVLERIRSAFDIRHDDPAYEIRLQCELMNIWYQLYVLFCAGKKKKSEPSWVVEAVKIMIYYVHNHYSEQISVKQLAKEANISERTGYRIFKECLHTTPVDYIINYRLSEACRMLIENKCSITEIAQACGFGSSSYFSKIFLRHFHCSPRDYRTKWQNKNNTAHDMYIIPEE